VDLVNTAAPRSDTREITETIVHLLRVNTGRGPTGAQTSISSDLVLVTLTECLTRAEKTLAERGHSDATLELRATLHHEIRDEAVACVEAITGRQVRAYLTAQEANPDVAILAFYLGK
jgi:uncharacterized protein YbcI